MENVGQKGGFKKIKVGNDVYQFQCAFFEMPGDKTYLTSEIEANDPIVEKLIKSGSGSLLKIEE